MQADLDSSLPSAGYVWDSFGGSFSKLRTMSFPERQKTAVAIPRVSRPSQPPCRMAKGIDSMPMPINMFTCTPHFPQQKAFACTIFNCKMLHVNKCYHVEGCLEDGSPFSDWRAPSRAGVFLKKNDSLPVNMPSTSSSLLRYCQLLL